MNSCHVSTACFPCVFQHGEHAEHGEHECLDHQHFVSPGREPVYALVGAQRLTCNSKGRDPILTFSFTGSVFRLVIPVPL